MDKSALFSGKNCLVFGAAQAVGRALCLRLAAQGGFVIAVDGDEDALQTLAAQHADRIAPLTLDMSDVNGLTRFAGGWSHDPLHLVIFAHPLYGAAQLSEDLASVTTITRGVAPILEASDGAAVLLFPAADEFTLSKAAAAAMATLTQSLADDGARINALALHPAAQKPDAAARVTQVALTMALPLTRPVCGAVLPVGQFGI